MAHMLGIKIGSLLVKTLTKPIANNLKRHAANPGWFRELCNNYGQFHHSVERRMSLRLLGHEAKKVKKMNEDEAVQLGANVMSEAFLLITAVALILFEMNRKAISDDEAKLVKDQQLQQSKQDLEQRFQNLEHNVAALQKVLMEQRALSGAPAAIATNNIQSIGNPASSLPTPNTAPNSVQVANISSSPSRNSPHSVDQYDKSDNNSNPSASHFSRLLSLVKS
jgi:hypothetical protein